MSGYTTLSGTSMAAPHVAGMAALVMSANPDLTNAEVRQLLIDTAERRGMGGGENNDYGFGVADPYAAVKAALGESGANPVTSPSVETRDDTTGAPATWVWDRDDVEHRFSLTVLLDAPVGQRGFELQVVPVGGVPFAYTHPAAGARHVNLDLAATLSGPYLFQFQGTSPGWAYSLDASADWPEDPPPWHGLELPLPPLP